MDVCKAWEDMKQEVAAKAEERRLLKDLKNVMKAFHLPLEQAMKALKVPEAKQAELAVKLNSLE